ncbi:MAG: DegT/DnrJ/EryC1/StrS family aminotransferase [Dehalococcoidia bacterium]|jgi:perosamine synthetase|nr:DegT/DnrJ/EryC1/StrS family aminotransferase [Dehalococcoidia bacterium]
MIPIAEPFLGQEELNNVIEAVRSGWVSSKGRFIPEFEGGFAAYCGVNHGVATSNGTVALHLALTALGIGPGDEVIVPALTFIATANAVTYTGAKPVFVDSHPDYWCVDPTLIEPAITPRTKAIIPVHLYGHPCDMDPIMSVARRHRLYVVEDAAEAHGAEYRGKRVGSFGDISCFSFYGNKIITTGEGGMCVTSNDELAKTMRILRDHGMNPERRYWHDVVGFNYRMTNLQAALGVAQLARLDALVARKREIAGWYAEALKPLADEGLLTLHPEMPWAKCVFWLYSVLLDGRLRNSAGRLLQELEAHAIEARPVFHPIPTMPPYSSAVAVGKVSSTISSTGVSLPSAPSLTPAQVSVVVRAVRSLSEERPT